MPLTLIDLGTLYTSDTDEQMFVQRQIQWHYYRMSLWRQGVVSAYIRYILMLPLTHSQPDNGLQRNWLAQREQQGAFRGTHHCGLRERGWRTCYNSPCVQDKCSIQEAKEHRLQSLDSG
jgi:hypothetical protein